MEKKAFNPHITSSVSDGNFRTPYSIPSAQRMLRPGEAPLSQEEYLTRVKQYINKHSRGRATSAMGGVDAIKKFVAENPSIKGTQFDISPKEGNSYGGGKVRVSTLHPGIVSHELGHAVDDKIHGPGYFGERGIFGFGGDPQSMLKSEVSATNRSQAFLKDNPALRGRALLGTSTYFNVAEQSGSFSGDSRWPAKEVVTDVRKTPHSRTVDKFVDLRLRRLEPELKAALGNNERVADDLMTLIKAKNKGDVAFVFDTDRKLATLKKANPAVHARVTELLNAPTLDTRSRHFRLEPNLSKEFLRENFKQHQKFAPEFAKGFAGRIESPTDKMTPQEVERLYRRESAKAYGKYLKENRMGTGFDRLEAAEQRVKGIPGWDKLHPPKSSPSAKFINFAKANKGKLRVGGALAVGAGLAGLALYNRNKKKAEGLS